ncbi:MAG: NAD-dependent epimerase/dehydratase family protein [Candidatus Sumerlaeales bacterium]|nr:NAD-dependent epimerase/dehydratase family protein [Candidatus Sumerlaeales bacterium]
MSTWLVTGGYGFIGSNIVKELIARGENVRVIDNLRTGRLVNLSGLEDKFKFYKNSILETTALDEAISGCDYVLHHAAMPSVQRSVEAPLTSNEENVTGTLSVLEAARKAKVKRVVYAASSSAYGNQPEMYKHEEMRPMPLSPYAVSKLTGEYYMQCYYQCYGLETVCLRYFNVFGSNQDPNSEYSAVIPLFITKCLRGERPTIYGDGTQSRDFTYVLNNVTANILAATTTKNVAGEVFNIACGTSFSLLDLLRDINAALKTDIEPIFAPARKGDVKHSLAKIDKAKNLLGYDVKVDFKSGLEKSIDWYRENCK